MAPRLPPSLSMPRPTASKAVRPALLSLALALLLACTGGASAASQAPAAPLPLPPFSRVASCLPFSMLIRPSGGGASGGSPAPTNGSARPDRVMVFAKDSGSAQAATAGQPAASAGGSLPYSLLLGASDPNITNAFQHSVSPDGTLHLGLSTPINTTSCASLVIELPADALREVRAGR